MRTITLGVVAALSCLASPALACKILAKYPEHLSGSTVGWSEPYRVVGIIEAPDEQRMLALPRE
jgi:hypothetical protein